MVSSSSNLGIQAGPVDSPSDSVVRRWGPAAAAAAEAVTTDRPETLLLEEGAARIERGDLEEAESFVEEREGGGAAAEK